MLPPPLPPLPHPFPHFTVFMSHRSYSVSFPHQPPSLQPAGATSWLPRAPRRLPRKCVSTRVCCWWIPPWGTLTSLSWPPVCAPTIWTALLRMCPTTSAHSSAWRTGAVSGCPLSLGCPVVAVVVDFFSQICRPAMFSVPCCLLPVLSCVN